MWHVLGYTQSQSSSSWCHDYFLQDLFHPLVHHKWVVSLWVLWILLSSQLVEISQWLPHLNSYSKVALICLRTYGNTSVNEMRCIECLHGDLFRNVLCVVMCVYMCSVCMCVLCVYVCVCVCNSLGSVLCKSLPGECSYKIWRTCWSWDYDVDLQQTWLTRFSMAIASPTGLGWSDFGPTTRAHFEYMWSISSHKSSRFGKWLPNIA